MSLALLLQMSGFTLAASISPRPVKLLCLCSGTRYPFREVLCLSLARLWASWR